MGFRVSEFRVQGLWVSDFQAFLVEGLGFRGFGFQGSGL